MKTHAGILATITINRNKQIIELEGWNILTHCLLFTLNQQYWFNIRHTLSYFTQLQITSSAVSAHIILFCRKGTDSNSSCVCFHNSIHFPDVLWWHAQTRANTTNCAVRWSHERIRACQKNKNSTILFQRLKETKTDLPLCEHFPFKEVFVCIFGSKAELK